MKGPWEDFGSATETAAPTAGPWTEFQPARAVQGPKPWEEAQSSIDALTKDHSYDPETHAAQNPQDFETAFAVHQKRQGRPFMEKVGDAIPKIPEMVGGALKGVAKFGAGLVATPLHTASQAALTAAAPALEATGHPELADKARNEALTEGAEATLAGQQVEQNLGSVGHSLKQLTPFADDPRTDFQNKVERARAQIALSQGKPQDTGAVASLSRMATGANPSEVFSPEALSEQGARPTSETAASLMSSAGDPMNLVYGAIPMLPGVKAVGGALTEGAGKVLSAPGKLVSKIPGTIGKFGKAAEGGSGVAAAAASILHPQAAATAGATVAGAKGLQWIGRALEEQGQAMRKGVPSVLDTQAATARMTGQGAKAINAQRFIGDTVAHGAATAVGMLPLNAALAEGDPEKTLESTVQAGAFGGAFGAFHSSRPALVEAARPYLRSEGARTMADMVEAADPLARRSADFISQLPEEAQHRVFETIGAIGGLGTETPNGTRTAKLYVLSDADYNAALAQVPPDQRPTGQSRGFFHAQDGSAYVNGQHASAADAGELAHTIGHEFGGHAALNILKAAGSKGGEIYNGLMSEVRKGLLDANGQPTRPFQVFVDAYNRAFDPTGQTKRLDPRNPDSMEEWIAETAGQIMSNSVGEIALPKTIMDRMNDGIGTFLGKLTGSDPRKVGGKTKFGREEIGSITQAVRDSLAQIAGMKQGGQELPAEGRPGFSSEPAVPPMNQRTAPVLGTAPKNVGLPLIPERTPYNPKPAPQGSIPPAVQLPPSPERTPYTPKPTVQQPPVEPIRLPEVQQPTIQPVQTATKPDTRRVMAALRLQGLNATEARQWATAAQGATAEEAVVDALKKRAAQKFPTQTPNATPAVPNVPAVAPAAEAKPAMAATLPRPAEEPGTVTRETLKAIGRQAADAAEADVVANRTARQKEHTLAPAVEKARSKAEFEAMAQAHSESLPQGTDLVRWQQDRFGNNLMVGKRIDPNDPFHAELIERGQLSPDTQRTIAEIQSKMDQPIGIEYLSAPEAPGAKAEFENLSGKQIQELRKKAQAEASASGRVAGEAPVRRVAKSFIPEGLKFNSSGTVTVNGFSPDKLLSNADKLLPWLSKKGIVSYDGVNDPQLMADLNGMAKNHRNGWLGNGMRPVESSVLTTVRPKAGYEPYVIPQERFDVLNALLSDTSAGELNEEGKPKRPTVERTEKQVLARLNSPFLNPETGEVNRIRELMAKEGDFTFTDSEGQQHTGKNVLENAWETLRPELIEKIGSPDIRNEHTLRPSLFTGNISGIDQTPRNAFSAAGFMPEDQNPRMSRIRQQARLRVSAAQNRREPATAP